jgi:hypothetical protein
MADPKTRETDASVRGFLDAIADPGKRADCKAIAKMMRAATGRRARMWGSSMVGYGRYRYRYASGREGVWFECGFSPRAQAITVYIMSGFGTFGPLMKRLGKYKTGKSCLYIRRLSDVDVDVLDQLIGASVTEIRRRHPE